MISPPTFLCYTGFRDRVVEILNSHLFVNDLGFIKGYYDGFPNPDITTNVPITPFFRLREPFCALQTCHTIGHDVPLWFNDLDNFLKHNPLSEEGKEFLNSAKRYYLPRYFSTVMIISQDPLRPNAYPGTIQLSSPWAMHGADYSKTPTYLVRAIIAAFLQAEKSVYITDYSKLYVNSNNIKGRSFVHMVKNYNSQMQSILRDEWHLLNQCGGVLTIQLGGMAGESSVDNFLQEGQFQAKKWNHPAAHGASYLYYIDKINNL